MKRGPSILALFVSLTATSNASSWIGDFKFGGLIDLYGLHDFGRPSAGTLLNGRWYDAHNEQERLAIAQLDVTRAADSKHLGLTLEFAAGDGPTILNATDPAGSKTFRYLSQAYATYVSPGARPYTLDVGRFYSWIGYESLESPNNENYGRSLLFTLAQPSFAVGLRLSRQIDPIWTATAYAANGFNESDTPDHRRALGATLAANPSSRLNLTFGLWHGEEGGDRPNDAGSFGGIGFPMPGLHALDLFDTYGSYSLSPTTKVALNASYATVTQGPASGQGNWSGVEGILRHSFGGRSAAALRVERFFDTNGLRTGVAQSLDAVTLTYDFNPVKAMTLRLELRRDFSNVPYFQTSGGLSRARTTLCLAQVFAF